MTKQQKEIVALVVLLLIAGGVWLYVSRRPAHMSTADSANVDSTLLAVENPQLRWWKIAEARKTEYQSRGRDPFSVIAPPPPVSPSRDHGKAPKRPAGPDRPPVIPPPPPPVLPVKFFGYGSLPNGSARRAFFTDQDQVFIAAEGEIILGRYRILHIGNDTVEFEEVSSGLRNTAPIEEQAPPS